MNSTGKKKNIWHKLYNTIVNPFVVSIIAGFAFIMQLITGRITGGWIEVVLWFSVIVWSFLYGTEINEVKRLEAKLQEMKQENEELKSTKKNNTRIL